MNKEIDYNEHEHDPAKMAMLNFDHIVDGIYIGNNFCCQVGLSDKLKEEGIDIDISLEESHVDNPLGVEAFLWLPTVDGQAPEPHLLTLGAMVLASAVSEGKKVYVHCQKGHGRSASLVMAYLLSQGHDFDEAFLKIKSAREDIHLNSTQVEKLRAYESGLKAS